MPSAPSLLFWRFLGVLLSLLLPTPPVNPARNSMRPELDCPLELERDYIAHCYRLPSYEP